MDRLESEIKKIEWLFKFYLMTIRLEIHKIDSYDEYL
jgi:hypothetical protein